MKYKIKLQLIELEDDNFHLVAPSDFNKGRILFWIIDTGASKSVFDLNLKHLYEPDGVETDQIHTAGIGDNPIHTTLGRLQSFSFARLQVNNLKVALLDLSHINKFYSHAANLHICGLLGSDFLLKNHALIDYKSKLLTLRVD